MTIQLLFRRKLDTALSAVNRNTIQNPYMSKVRRKAAEKHRRCGFANGVDGTVGVTVGGTVSEIIKKSETSAHAVLYLPDNIRKKYFHNNLLYALS